MEINSHEGPEQIIQHSIDKHPLMFMEKEGRRCELCHKDLDGPTRGCSSCNFYIHLSCAALKMDARGQISCHDHPLTHLYWWCELCTGSLQGPLYGCDICLHYVHKSCAELQQEIHHPLHPAHSLTLGAPWSNVCNACGLQKRGPRTPIYKCDKCQFFLHQECVSVTPSIKYQGHHHLLTLVERILFEESQCEACGKEIKGTLFLRCVQCKINFHVQCDFHQLPPTILHKHHQHPLNLVNEIPAKDDRDLFHCAACKEEMDPQHPFYFCVECDYFAHVRCVLTEIKFVEEKKVVKHFSHRHFLIPTEGTGDVFCDACQKNIQGTAYSCQSCRIYLHKSCAELPRERHHPFHKHALTLPEPYSKQECQCNACHKFCYGFTYRCSVCDFDLDLDCISLQASIKYEGHDEHNLTFIEKLYDAPECTACSSILDVSYLRCVICNFNIHLMCSPLPKTLNHWSHELHPLALLGRFVDDNYDMQICDVCEKERNPQECVYYCIECDFIAGFDCVTPEVIHCLEGKCEDVKLKSVANKDEGDRKYITLLDIYRTCTEEESQRIGHITQEVHKYINTMFEGGTGSNVDISESYFIRLSKNLPLWDIPSPYFIDKREKVVSVKDFMIPRKLARILKNLIDKYKDFTSDCIFTTQNGKTILLAYFCAVVQSMCNTKIMDITDSLLCQWWSILKFVQFGGFKIDFAMRHLWKIGDERRTNDIIQTYRNRPYYRHNMKMVEVSRKIDRMYEQINELNAEMEEIRSEKQDAMSGYCSEESKSEAKYLDEAFEILIKNACMGLL